VLPKEDEDMAEIVKKQLIADGVTFRLLVVEYTKIELTGNVLENGYHAMKITLMEKGEADSTSIICDAVLVATGRCPNVTGMDLENVKVEYCTKAQTTDDQPLCLWGWRLLHKFKCTHAADFMAQAVIWNALFFDKDKMSNLLIPYATSFLLKLQVLVYTGKIWMKKASNIEFSKTTSKTTIVQFVKTEQRDL
jgi:hypothetical protein